MNNLKYQDAPPTPDTHKPARSDAKACRNKGHIIIEVNYYDDSGIGWCTRCGLVWHNYKLKELRGKGLIKEAAK